MYLTEIIQREFLASRIPHLGKSSLLEVHYRHGDLAQKHAVDGAFQILCERTLAAMIEEARLTGSKR